MSRRSDYILGSIIILSVLLFVIIVLSVSSSMFDRRGLSFSSDGKRVALVEIEGPITVAEPVVTQLKKYREYTSVPVVVLRINSPGGSVAATQEIYHELEMLRDSGKKVVASMGNMAASGGYYLACVADTIVANPGTLTGSIGVIFEFANTEELFRKIGIRFQVVKSGKFKDIGSPTREMTEEERLLLQELIDDAYNQFVDAVSEGRELPREEVLRIADGRVFTGRQGLELGLIDVMGGYEEAIALAAEMAGIRGKPKTIKEWRRRLTVWDVLLERIGGKLSPTELMPSLEYRFR